MYITDHHNYTYCFNPDCYLKSHDIVLQSHDKVKETVPLVATIRLYY